MCLPMYAKGEPMCSPMYAKGEPMSSPMYAKGEHTGSPLRYIPKDRKLLVGFLNFWKNKKPPRKMLGGLDFVQPKNLKFSAE